MENTLTENSEGRLVETPTKTRKSRRAIVLPGVAVQALEFHFRRRVTAPEDLVFTASGAPIRKSNFIRRQFLPMLSAAGLPRITFHSLRHIHATYLLAAGASLEAVSEQLGHATIRTTADIYVHLRVTPMMHALAQLADSVFPSPMAEQTAEQNTEHRGVVEDPSGGNVQRQALSLVEMRGLEPPTPYMRSKCSTS